MAARVVGFVGSAGIVPIPKGKISNSNRVMAASESRKSTTLTAHCAIAWARTRYHANDPGATGGAGGVTLEIAGNA